MNIFDLELLKKPIREFIGDDIVVEIPIGGDITLQLASKYSHLRIEELPEGMYCCCFWFEKIVKGVQVEGMKVLETFECVDYMPIGYVISRLFKSVSL